jgi:hypothetical protein
MDVREPNRPTFTADREVENESREVFSEFISKIHEVTVLRVTKDDSLVIKFDPDHFDAWSTIDFQQVGKTLKERLGVKAVVFMPKGMDLEVVRKG